MKEGVQVFNPPMTNEVRDSHGAKSKIIITSEERNELNCIPPGVANVQNMLIFWTTIIPAEHFTLKVASPFIKEKYANEDSTGSLMCQIFDSSYRSCGLLFCDRLVLDGNYQIILISKWGTGLLVSRVSYFTFTDEALTEPHNVYDAYYEDQRTHTKTLNVMLIRWFDGGYAVRVAIGQIHEHAWEELKPMRRKIYLS